MDYNLKKIESFKVDHTKLLPGVYVSRKDYDNDSQKVIATTFDIRMKRPNIEPAMNTAEIHTIEHLGATFLRNDPKFKNEIMYFGPMGCRTGFYAMFKGDLSTYDVLDIIIDMFYFISNYKGDIPGADEFSCGNYLDQNLTVARYEAQKYLDILCTITDENLVYPT